MKNSNKNKNAKRKKVEFKDKFVTLKSNFFLRNVFDNLEYNKYLKIIRYNKQIQQRLNLSIKDYIDYGKIKIEIIPIEKAVGQFINIIFESETKYFHIYFNNNFKKEIHRTCLKKNDKVNKINVILDQQITSFYKLFDNCKCIKSVSFKSFNRKNIRNMELMFNKCSSLKEIDLSNFHTDNVCNMDSMFSGCPFEKINLSNFITDNVKSLEGMFSSCSSLKEINLSKFNTSKVSSMAWMFSGCISLKEIDISYFNCNNLGRVSFMFSNCTGLKNIVFNSNFNINDYIANNTFKGCSGELQDKMRKYFKNINEQAFFSHHFA